MNKFKKIFFVLFFAMLLIPSLAVAQEMQKTTAVYFYSANCLHCQRVKPYLQGLEDQYKDKINVKRFEIYYSQPNRDLFNVFLDDYNIPTGTGGVPIIFIGDEYLMGDQQIISDLKAKFDQYGSSFVFLKDSLDQALSSASSDVVLPVSERSKLTLGLIIGTAFIDSINPCAIGVLLFLISFVLASMGSRRRLLTIGLTYIFAVFLSYLLAGLGLLKFIAVFNLGRIIIIIAAIILFFSGLISIKDCFWPGKGVSLKIPDRAKLIIDKYLKVATIPAVFVAGFLVALFELPCTGEVYLGILSLIAKIGLNLSSLFYLILYNFVFVLPLILILLFAAFGFNVSKIESFHLTKKKWARLLVGLLMIVLAAWLLKFN